MQTPPTPASSSQRRLETRASKAGSRDSKASKRVMNCATGRVLVDSQSSGRPRMPAMLHAVETSMMVTSGKERRMRRATASKRSVPNSTPAQPTAAATTPPTSLAKKIYFSYTCLYGFLG
jgi:hypothetical protein